MIGLAVGVGAFVLLVGLFVLIGTMLRYADSRTEPSSPRPSLASE